MLKYNWLNIQSCLTLGFEEEKNSLGACCLTPNTYRMQYNFENISNFMQAFMDAPDDEEHTPTQALEALMSKQK